MPEDFGEDPIGIDEAAFEASGLKPVLAKYRSELKTHREAANRERTHRETTESELTAARALLAERDNALVREAVARAASRAGLLDEDYLDLPAFTDAFKNARIENGRVIGAAEVVAAMQTTKPSFFETESRPRGNDGRFERPTPSRHSGAVDASKLDAKEFDELTERLRRGRA